MLRWRLKLFTSKRLKQELSEFQLETLRISTIHSVTNFIPSTYLDMNNPPNWLKDSFTFLASIEERITTPLPGCSIILLARKMEK